MVSCVSGDGPVMVAKKDRCTDRIQSTEYRKSAYDAGIINEENGIISLTINKARGMTSRTMNEETQNERRKHE